MERQIRIVGIKRKEIDEEKLALAFLMLAKTLHNQHEQRETSTSDASSNEAEAA